MPVLDRLLNETLALLGRGSTHIWKEPPQRFASRPRGSNFRTDPRPQNNISTQQETARKCTSQEDPYQSVMSSETLQSSKLPSGKYRRMTNGILRCDSSLMAISNGSVSPSSGTRMGAFMLWRRSELVMVTKKLNIPNLKSTSTKYTRSLVFGHIGRCYPYSVWFVELLPTLRTHLLLSLRWL